MIEIEIKRLKRISNYGRFMQHDIIQIYSMTGVVPSQDSFGTLKDGTPVSRYVLDVVILSGFTYKLRSNSVFYIFIIHFYRFSFTNRNNVTVRVINYGATITDILLPDKNGTVEDISLGFDSVQGLLNVVFSLKFITCIINIIYFSDMCLKMIHWKKKLFVKLLKYVYELLIMEGVHECWEYFRIRVSAFLHWSCFGTRDREDKRREIWNWRRGV